MLVTATEAHRIAPVQQRNGRSEAEVRARMLSQMAEHDGDREHLRRQVQTLVTRRKRNSEA